MTGPSPSKAADVNAARIDVERRRGEMIETVHLLQARLAPRTLAGDAWAKAKDKGADLAEEAVDAVKARPVAVGGAAAAVALFLAREPLTEAAIKLYDAVTSRGDRSKKRNSASPHPTADHRRTAPRKTRTRTAPKTEKLS